MTEQEIERIRTFLGSEYSVTTVDGSVVVDKVDIWKGVEFAECVEYHKGSRTGAEIIKGHIYKITDWFKRELVYFDGFEYGWPVLFFKHSTEAAYVEQLKAKAKELYGEIKDGDRFWIDENLGEVSMYDCEDGFSYWKEEDLLYFGNYAIYSKGKWAKKIERVRVVPSEIYYPKPDNLDQYVTVELRIIGGLLDSTKSKGAIEELAKCLEDYLNKIP